MTKTKTPPTETIDVEWIEVGNTLRIWIQRKQQWGFAVVETIGSKFFHVKLHGKVIKINRTDTMFLMNEGESFWVVA